MERRGGKVCRVAIMAVLSFLIGSSELFGAGENIFIGIIAPLTGPSGYGAGEGYGFRDFINLANEKGGISGWLTVDTMLIDGKHNTAEEVRGYKLFISKNAAFIRGYSTDSTKAMKDMINNTDRVPFITASLSEDIIDPKKYPFIFALGATYEDQIRLALRWVKGKGAKSIAFVNPSLEYGIAPVKNIINENYPAKVGLNLVEQISHPYGAPDLSAEMLRLKRSKPDFVYLQQIATETITTIRDANKVGMKADRFIGMNWAVSPSIPQQLGKTAEGYMGMRVFIPWGSDFPIMKEIEEFEKTHTIRTKDEYYIRGWIEGKIVVEAIRRAIEKDKKIVSNISKLRAEIRDQIENLDKFEIIGGQFPPLRYSDHKGIPYAVIVQVVEGKYKEITDWLKLD